MFVRAAALACLFSLAGSVTAHAEEREATTTPAAAVPAVTSNAEPSAPSLPSWVTDRHQGRPATLTALYGSYGALAVADFVSTKKAIAAGGREGNPLMGSGKASRMMLVKGAGAAMSIYFAERMWKKNKIGAIVTMVAVNGLSAAVVAHNTQIARR